MLMSMTARPRASLGRVLEDLGATLLEVVSGDADDPETLGGIVIHDPLDEIEPPHHAVVLGVGVHGSEEIVRMASPSECRFPQGGLRVALHLVA